MDIDYNEKLVAFIDILGFRKLVNQNPDEAKKTIYLINNVLSHALKMVKTNNPENVFSLKLFSDCICISARTEHTYEMFYELAYIQLWLSMHGIFLRGALTRGLHFENENIIFSRGLIDAYEREREAIYPRIVIDNSIVKIILEDKDPKFVMKSPDRLFFVDYLDFIDEEGNSEPDVILENHKNAILTQLRANFEDTRICDKYRWLSEYHNIKASKFLGSPDDWDIKYYEELRKKIVIPVSRYFLSFMKAGGRTE